MNPACVIAPQTIFASVRCLEHAVVSKSEHGARGCGLLSIVLVLSRTVFHKDVVVIEGDNELFFDRLPQVLECLLWRLLRDR